MSACAKCGGYFSVTKQTAFCPECEKSNVSNCDIPVPQDFGKQEGWICPVCGRGLAPWTSFCPCQGSEIKITYGTSTGGDWYIKEYLDYMKNYNNEDLKL